MSKKYLPATIALLCFFCGLFLVVRPHVYAFEETTKDHPTGGVRADASRPTGKDDVTVEHKIEPAKITAGTPTTITFSLKDRQGNPLQGLSVHHDRILHVVIVGQDFSEFAHVHPEDLGPVTSEMKKLAAFPVKYTFPKGGRYLIGVDFAVGEQLFSKHFQVYAAGQQAMGFTWMDLSKKKSFGRLDVSLEATPEQITAGKEVTLRYLFSRHGKPMANLEPYLSAPMHVSIVSADFENFIHVHGELPAAHPAGQHEHHMQMALPKKFGPEVDVHVVFPAKGLYQIFGEVGHRGEVILTRFMVQVE